MDIKKLFETQAKLDKHIMQEHPELRGQSNLDWKLLALQVELGECANEWRGFKKWSKDQEPRTVKRIETEWDDDGTPTEWDVYQDVNPLLEEYVDCLHFILSIGLEIDTKTTVDWDDIEFFETDITEQFIEITSRILELRSWEISDTWAGLFSEFYVLGKMLGFTWEQVEEAYYAKNKVNYARQESGY